MINYRLWCRRRSWGWLLGFCLRQQWIEKGLHFVLEKNIMMILFSYIVFISSKCEELKKNTALLKYNLHSVQFTHIKWPIQCFWYICRIVQLPPESNFRTFSSSLKETPVPISSQSPFLLSPTPQTTNLLFVSVNLFIVYISCKWNHRMYSLL